MLSFLGLLLQNWRYVLVFGALIAGLAYTLVLQHDVKELSTVNTTLTKQVTELQTTNTNIKNVYEQRITSLTSAIDVQNQNITDYQNKVVALQAQAKVDADLAVRTRATYDAAVQKILTDTTLTDKATCQQSMDYLNAGTNDLKWSTK